MSDQDTQPATEPTTPAAPSGLPGPSVPSDPSDLWSVIDELWTWLEADQPVGGREGMLLRLLKLSEEVGEVAEAVIGATGHNPRKGASHTWDDVQAELCDVAVTALVALRTLAPDTREVFTTHLSRLRERTRGTRETRA